MKRIRIIVSGIVLISFLSCFLLPGNISDSLLSYIASFQFFPSLIKIIKTGTVTTTLILIPVLTLIFGRIYCSTICPLGTLQDCSSIINRKKKFNHKKQNLFLTYSIPLISIIFLTLSIPLIILIIEPYSIVSRSACFILQPLGLRTNLAASNFVFYFSSTFLLIILFFSFFKGRIYCNSICPVGAILSIFSKFSIFSLSIEKSKCTSCGKCEKICKTECINANDCIIDNSKCVKCFNCFSICKSEAIKYSIKNNNKLIIARNKKNNEQHISRKSFLGLGVMGILSYPASKFFHKKSFTKIPVTPPGSTGLKAFHGNLYCLSTMRCPMSNRSASPFILRIRIYRNDAAVFRFQQKCM